MKVSFNLEFRTGPGSKEQVVSMAASRSSHLVIRIRKSEKGGYKSHCRTTSSNKSYGSCHLLAISFQRGKRWVCEVQRDVEGRRREHVDSRNVGILDVLHPFTKLVAVAGTQPQTIWYNLGIEGTNSDQFILGFEGKTFPLLVFLNGWNQKWTGSFLPAEGQRHCRGIWSR